MVEPGCKARLLLLRTTLPGGHPAPPWVWLCPGMRDEGHSADSKGLSLGSGVPEEKRERRAENSFEKVVAENFPNLGKETDI